MRGRFAFPLQRADRWQVRPAPPDPEAVPQTTPLAASEPPPPVFSPAPAKAVSDSS